MGIRKLVKFLIVRNLLYEIGLKDINLQKILQEEGNHIRTQKYCFELIMDKPPL